ncbi:hypothetical protein ANO14919_127550 [Xylariales sp. No.14919]|nr:hypothetical protein ANO14919_127550 [Xylariales sp. No.14919]
MPPARCCRLVAVSAAGWHSIISRDFVQPLAITAPVSYEEPNLPHSDSWSTPPVGDYEILIVGLSGLRVPSLDWRARLGHKLD